jgi:TP901 family phage tail tape measure protein
VAQVKADLYRQGLSDSEVDSRSDAILKFATVTGTKVTQATKIITTALQNDLVSSAQQAMDVLTALGDSAATTAEEIGKGMQKSAAAAKVAGVSFNELTSMLTIITSKTQLGGSQAGTALAAIFNRMHRV